MRKRVTSNDFIDNLELSNIARRWAWQNPHVTKKIPDAERITWPAIRKQKSRRTGETRPVKGRPSMSLKDRISNLHLLLRVSSFTRWPLQVRFFSKEVHQLWRTWAERCNGTIRNGITVVLDSSPAKPRDNPVQNAVQSLDIGYGQLKLWIARSLELTGNRSNRCSICARAIVGQGHAMLVCPEASCCATSHLACLARTFLDGQDGKSAIPLSGKCTKCNTQLRWADLVKELSLRTRGEKEVALLFKRRQRRGKGVGRVGEDLSSDVAVEEMDETDEEDVEEDFVTASAYAASTDEKPSPRDCSFYVELDDDMTSVTSMDSEISDATESINVINQEPDASRVGFVIEDSEDEAEIRD